MEAKGSHKLNDVYGLSRDIPLTYTTRPTVDERFKSSIARDKHIVIHGSSKQGKTCLRKFHLKEDEYIPVQCTRDFTKAKLYEMILKRAGVVMTIEKAESSAMMKGGKATTGAEGGLWIFAKAKAEVTGEMSSKGETTTKTKSFDIDLTDPNDIVRVLEEATSTRLIVIEDFHYLEEEVQESIAFDLKVFHETSKFIFMIVGVWLEANRLMIYNGDLAGRLSTIDADKWSEAELKEVVKAGFPFLNITMTEDVISALVAGCQGNVGLLQEVCNQVCEGENVTETLPTVRQIGDVERMKTAYRLVAAEQAARYINFLTKFSEGLTETQYQMYRWIAWVVIHATSIELRHGLKTSAIFQRVASQHPSKDSLQQNNIAQALDRVAKVQFRHKIQPPVLDYSDGRLRVVDANFLVFLENQDLAQLRSVIAIPNVPTA